MTENVHDPYWPPKPALDGSSLPYIDLPGGFVALASSPPDGMILVYRRCSVSDNIGGLNARFEAYGFAFRAAVGDVPEAHRRFFFDYDVRYEDNVQLRCMIIELVRDLKAAGYEDYVPPEVTTTET
jgi:hypothetical protein